MMSGMDYFQYKAQVEVPGATIRLTRINVNEPMDASFRQTEGYWLDCSLTPRTPNARGCFSERAASHHYQPFGTIFMVPPEETLLARTDCGEQVSLLCVLKEDYVRRWLEEDFIWTHRHMEASMNVQAAPIMPLLQRLGEEVRRPGVASDILCEAITVQLAIELGRYYRAIGERPEPGGLAGWRLRLVEERIREVDEPPSLNELADMCGLSVRQLTRGYRAAKGQSLGDYITEARMARAKRMLVDGERIKTIAFSLGFASSSSFCYAFRRATSYSPREFRLFASA